MPQTDWAKFYDERKSMEFREPGQPRKQPVKSKPVDTGKMIQSAATKKWYPKPKTQAEMDAIKKKDLREQGMGQAPKHLTAPLDQEKVDYGAALKSEAMKEGRYNRDAHKRTLKNTQSQKAIAETAKQSEQNRPWSEFVADALMGAIPGGPLLPKRAREEAINAVHSTPLNPKEFINQVTGEIGVVTDPNSTNDQKLGGIINLGMKGGDVVPIAAGAKTIAKQGAKRVADAFLDTGMERAARQPHNVKGQVFSEAQLLAKDSEFGKQVAALEAKNPIPAKEFNRLDIELRAKRKTATPAERIDIDKQLKELKVRLGAHQELEKMAPGQYKGDAPKTPEATVQEPIVTEPVATTPKVKETWRNKKDGSMVYSTNRVKDGNVLPDHKRTNLHSTENEFLAEDLAAAQAELARARPGSKAYKVKEERVKVLEFQMSKRDPSKTGRVVEEPDVAAMFDPEANRVKLEAEGRIATPEPAKVADAPVTTPAQKSKSPHRASLDELAEYEDPKLLDDYIYEMKQRLGIGKDARVKNRPGGRWKPATPEERPELTERLRMAEARRFDLGVDEINRTKSARGLAPIVQESAVAKLRKSPAPVTPKPKTDLPKQSGSPGTQQKRGEPMAERARMGPPTPHGKRGGYFDWSTAPKNPKARTVSEDADMEITDKALAAFKAATLTNPASFLRDIVSTVGGATVDNATSSLDGLVDFMIYNKMRKTQGKASAAMITDTLPSYFENGGAPARWLKEAVDRMSGTDEIAPSRYGQKSSTKGADAIYRFRGLADVMTEDITSESTKRQMRRINPGLSEAEIKDIADGEAIAAILANDNKFADAWNAARGTAKGPFSVFPKAFMDVLVRFPKIPSNVAGRMTDYSPLGFGKALVKHVEGVTSEGGLTVARRRTVNRLVSRGMVGSALYVGGGYAYEAGHLDPVIDKGEKIIKWFKDNPYIDFEDIIPQAKIFFLGAGNKAIESSDMTEEQKLKFKAVLLAETALDTPGARGAGKVTSMKRQPIKEAERMLAAGSVPGIVSWFAEFMDALYNEGEIPRRGYEGPGDEFKKKIPGYREQVPTQEELDAPKKKEEDPLDKILNKHGIGGESKKNKEDDALDRLLKKHGID